MFEGQRVLVFSEKNSFLGMRGRVTQTEPIIMVHLDGERLPMAFGQSELVAEEESAHHAGAE